jgi:hypothetical protein
MEGYETRAASETSRWLAAGNGMQPGKEAKTMSLKEATKVSASLVLPCDTDVEPRTSIASTEIPSTPVRVELRIHSTSRTFGCVTGFFHF